MSKVFIEESTLVGMADLIRESKGTTDLYDPANFRDEFKEIIENGSGGSSIDGGFTVNFYSEDGELIESHSAELGRDVYAPDTVTEVNYWSDENGVPYTFPITINTADTVLNLYATNAKTCAQVLYDTFDVDDTEYPRVALYYHKTDAVITVSFGVSIPSTGTLVAITKRNVPTTLSTEDMCHMVQYVVDNKDSCQRNTGNYGYSNVTTDNARYFANFDLDFERMEGRLDETMFTTDDRLHPYALQEKIVTESGDVVPDEGYYGLSKVSVNVESGTVVPIGTVLSHPNNLWSDSYLKCDGTVYTITEYQELADAILNSYGYYNHFGGDGVSTFAVPNMYEYHDIVPVLSEDNDRVIKSGEWEDFLFAWNAFDGYDNTAWAVLGTSDVWIGYDFGQDTIIDSYRITSRKLDGNDIGQSPTAFRLEGYNANTDTWETIDTRTTGISFTSSGETKTFIISPVAYSKYRLYITAVKSSTTATSIGELQFCRTQYGYIKSTEG